MAGSAFFQVLSVFFGFEKLNQAIGDQFSQRTQPALNSISCNILMLVNGEYRQQTVFSTNNQPVRNGVVVNFQIVNQYGNIMKRSTLNEHF